MDSTHRTCKNCKYYDRNSDYTGKCRLNPPPPANVSYRWPVVKHNDWCSYLTVNEDAPEQ